MLCIFKCPAPGAQEALVKACSMSSRLRCQDRLRRGEGPSKQTWSSEEDRLSLGGEGERGAAG